MTTETADLTIRKMLHVAVPVEQAFDTFTNGWADWWPTDTHSLDQGTPDIEWRVGGTAGEIVRGERKEWADILEFDPPHGFAMRWRVNPENPPTDLRVTFTAEGDGTRVELTHAGWEAYGDAARDSYTDYNGGWDEVLGHYVRYAPTA